MRSNPKIQENIARFKKQREKAREKGFEILPSVNGPYVFCPKSEMVIGRQGSEQYKMATS
jgi:hypothetical protein